MRELFFKCIGAILVLYTGAAMGWRKGNAAMRRVQVLADICAFLGTVRDDLHFRCGRTEEILAAAQQNTRLSALPLYFSDLASGCGLQTELDNALCRTEREIAGVTRREVMNLAFSDNRNICIFCKPLHQFIIWFILF